MTRFGSGSVLLLLTGVSVFSEVALLVASYHAGDPVAITCLVLGSYHCGYLLADRSPFSRSRLPVSTSLLLVLFAGALWHWSWPLAASIALLLSTALQGWRRDLKPKSGAPSRSKNVAKFAGMVAGGIAAFPFISALVVIMIALISIRLGPPAGRAATAPATGSVSAVMRRLAQVEFFHHLHYFLYVYVFWSRLRDLPLPALGALFTIGWAAYFVAETILRERRRLFSPAAIAAGHLLCAASIAGMLCTRQLAVSMVLWFLTGLGGGTAYMLGNGPQHPDRERYEDSGHVAGALVAGLAAGLVSAELALGLAVVAALLTALLALSIQTIRKDTPCQ